MDSVQALVTEMTAQEPVVSVSSISPASAFSAVSKGRFLQQDREHLVLGRGRYIEFVDYTQGKFTTILRIPAPGAVEALGILRDKRALIDWIVVYLGTNIVMVLEFVKSEKRFKNKYYYAFKNRDQEDILEFPPLINSSPDLTKCIVRSREGDCIYLKCAVVGITSFLDCPPEPKSIVWLNNYDLCFSWYEKLSFYRAGDQLTRSKSRQIQYQDQVGELFPYKDGFISITSQVSYVSKTETVAFNTGSNELVISGIQVKQTGTGIHLLCRGSTCMSLWFISSDPLESKLVFEQKFAPLEGLAFAHGIPILLEETVVIFFFKDCFEYLVVDIYWGKPFFELRMESTPNPGPLRAIYNNPICTLVVRGHGYGLSTSLTKITADPLFLSETVLTTGVGNVWRVGMHEYLITSLVGSIICKLEGNQLKLVNCNYSGDTTLFASKGVQVTLDRVYLGRETINLSSLAAYGGGNCQLICCTDFYQVTLIDCSTYSQEKINVGEEILCCSVFGTNAAFVTESGIYLKLKGRELLNKSLVLDNHFPFACLGESYLCLKVNGISSVLFLDLNLEIVGQKTFEAPITSLATNPTGRSFLLFCQEHVYVLNETELLNEVEPLRIQSPGLTFLEHVDSNKFLICRSGTLSLAQMTEGPTVVEQILNLDGGYMGSTTIENTLDVAVVLGNEQESFVVVLDEKLTKKYARPLFPTPDPQRSHCLVSSIVFKESNNERVYIIIFSCREELCVFDCEKQQTVIYAKVSHTIDAQGLTCRQVAPDTLRVLCECESRAGRRIHFIDLRITGDAISLESSDKFLDARCIINQEALYYQHSRHPPCFSSVSLDRLEDLGRNGEVHDSCRECQRYFAMSDRVHALNALSHQENSLENSSSPGYLTLGEGLTIHRLAKGDDPPYYYIPFGEYAICSSLPLCAKLDDQRLHPYVLIGTDAGGLYQLIGIRYLEGSKLLKLQLLVLDRIYGLMNQQRGFSAARCINFEVFDFMFELDVGVVESLCLEAGTTSDEVREVVRLTYLRPFDWYRSLYLPEC